MSSIRNSASRLLFGLVCCVLVSGLSGASGVSRAPSLEMEGFAEPYRLLKVAADETGTIEEVFVHEGQTVEAGQPLARLNSDVHKALLAIADQNMHAEGRLAAARANLQMQQQRLDTLEALHSNGHARHEEVDRARAEVAVAEANILATQEELLTRKLEYEKIRTQIARRTILAPVSGVVTTLHKDLGEFVAPTTPEVLTLVQIDTLLANFTLMSPQAKTIQLNQELKVRFPASRGRTTGIVEYISPVTDAESGTVLVKLRIDNADGRFRSGERCKISIGK